MAKNDYFLTKIGDKVYKKHRIIWEAEHGPIPEGMHIDHINGNGKDNRLVNLRLATNQENMRNIKVKPMTNIQERCGGFRVRLMIDGVSIYFGTHDSLELAQLVRDEAREKYFGEFKGRYS